MPARVTLFNLKCEPLVDFGEASRNIAKWSPSGKYIFSITLYYLTGTVVCIAGFGNLQGHVDFWDRKKALKIGTSQADFTSYFEWSPNGTCLLTAVLFPRMRVDNDYDGKLLHRVPVKDELYEVVWKPVPQHLISKLAAVQAPKEANDKVETITKAPAPASTSGKYVHPNATKGASAMKTTEQHGPVVYKKDTPATSAKKELPPGYDFAEESKNKKKGKKPAQKKPAPKEIEEPEF